MTSEIPQFFANRSGRRLFTILHVPHPAQKKGPRLAVVCCAPLFEEKLWTHRVLVNLARFLAKNGVAVLRFDYFGDGESEGLFEEASVASRLDDSLDAAAFCRQQIGADLLFMLGIRYGANIAVRTALANDQINGAVAWAPVMDGSRYVNDLLRVHLTAQLVVHRKVIHDRDALIAQIQSGETVNIEGYELGGALYRQVIAMDLLEHLHAATKPILLQQISPGEEVERQYSDVPVMSANHCIELQRIREARFWLQQKNVFPPCAELFARTLDWLLLKSSELPTG